MNQSNHMRKLQVLNYLEVNNEQDGRQIAQTCQMTFEAAGMLLLRLFRLGWSKESWMPKIKYFFIPLPLRVGID